MKTTFTCSLLLLLSVAFAQPVLTFENNSPQIGQTYRASVMLDTFPELPGGPNAVWDFSNLEPFLYSDNTPAELTFSYNDLALETWSNEFPDGDITESCDLCSATFIYDSDESARIHSGFYATVINNNQPADWFVYYQNEQIRFPYPFAYDNQSNDTYYSEYELGGFSFTRSGTIESHADGYGTVILPWGTIPNVLRVHIIMNEVEQIPNFNPAFGEFHVYEYYAPGVTIPILSTQRDYELNASGDIIQLYQQQVIWLNPEISGCNDPLACNYDPLADTNDGSCSIIGSPCDDGLSETTNDVIAADCMCVGEVVIAAGCTMPDACNYDMTATDDDGSCFFVSDPCDDGNSGTVNDLYNLDCVCEGTAGSISGCTDQAACNFILEATEEDGSCLYVGSPCDDGLVETINDMIDADCMCLGEFAVVTGCTMPDACNYNTAATADDGSCVFIGDPCDDGNPESTGDVYNTACECEGLVTVDETIASSALYPNPAKDFIQCLIRNNVPERIEIYDMRGSLILTETKTNRVSVAMLANGLYTVKMKLGNDTIIRRLEIIK